MHNIEHMLTTLNNVASISDQIEYALGRIDFLENEVRRLKNLEENCWMPISQAASSLGKSVDAVRQRLKHKKKPMPEGVVWKQDGPGCSISVHLGNYRRSM